MENQGTTQTASVAENLEPFQPGEDRAKEFGRLGGAQSTKKKQLAAKIREFKKRYPQCEQEIANFIGILSDIDAFQNFTEAEVLKLMFMKEMALRESNDTVTNYKIQQSFLMASLEVGKIFFDHGEFRRNSLANSNQPKKVVPWEQDEEVLNLKREIEESRRLQAENARLRERLEQTSRA